MAQCSSSNEQGLADLRLEPQTDSSLDMKYWLQSKVNFRTFRSFNIIYVINFFLYNYLDKSDRMLVWHRSHSEYLIIFNVCYVWTDRVLAFHWPWVAALSLFQRCVFYLIIEIRSQLLKYIGVVHDAVNASKTIFKTMFSNNYKNVSFSTLF